MPPPRSTRFTTLSTTIHEFWIDCCSYVHSDESPPAPTGAASMDHAIALHLLPALDANVAEIHENVPRRSINCDRENPEAEVANGGHHTHTPGRYPGGA